MRRLIVGVLVAAALVGCKDDPMGPEPMPIVPDVSGQWVTEWDHHGQIVTPLFVIEQAGAKLTGTADIDGATWRAQGTVSERGGVRLTIYPPDEVGGPSLFLSVHLTPDEKLDGILVGLVLGVPEFIVMVRPAE